MVAEVETEEEDVVDSIEEGEEGESEAVADTPIEVVRIRTRTYRLPTIEITCCVLFPDIPGLLDGTGRRMMIGRMQS